MRKTLGPRALLLLWTLLLPVPAAYVSQVMIRPAAPVVRESQMERTVFSQSESLFFVIRVTMKGAALGWRHSTSKIPLQSMDLSLDLTKHAIQPLHFDLVGRFYRYTDAAGKTVQGTGDLDERVLADWLAAAGFKTDSDESRYYIGAMVLAIRETPQAAGKFTNLAPDPKVGGAPKVNAPPTNVNRLFFPEPPWWVNVLVWVFWVLVWLAGARAIWKRRRSVNAASEVAPC